MQVETKIIDIELDKNTVISNDYIEPKINIKPDSLLRWAIVDADNFNLKLCVTYTNL